MKTKLIIVAFVFTAAFSTGCRIIDDEDVAVNQYRVLNRYAPVANSPQMEMRSRAEEIEVAKTRKVYIGHDLPVEVTIDAKYAEDDIPVQFYLLHAEDIEEYENGTGDLDDVRFYYLDRTVGTTIEHIDSGTNTYRVILNVPANDAKDQFTGDLKTGLFYIIAEVNKDGKAEIDIIEAYNKYKNNTDLTYTSVINVASDKMNYPDLVLEQFNLTGGAGGSVNSTTFLDLKLSNLPGAEQIVLPGINGLPDIPIYPSYTDRIFFANIHVRASSCDVINVPVNFNLTGPYSFTTPLYIYDSDMEGWVQTYYIPYLKANTSESISLALMIPDNKAATYEYPVHTSWPEGFPVTPTSTIRTDLFATYPLVAMRARLNEGYKSYNNWDITCDINFSSQSGLSKPVQECRFITGNYLTGGEDYYDPYGQNSSASNNLLTRNFYINLEEMNIETNEGINMYPACKKNPPAANGDDNQLVIFWDGIGFCVGDNSFGAGGNVHEGAFFHRMSLYSMGMNLYGTVLSRRIDFIDMYCNASSYPTRPDLSGYAIKIQKPEFDRENKGSIYKDENSSDDDTGTPDGGRLSIKSALYMTTILEEAGVGFTGNTPRVWESPITLYTKKETKEKWVYCFKFQIEAGLDIVLTPGIRLYQYDTGALNLEKFLRLQASAYADANASLAGMAGMGLYTFLDVLGLEFRQKTYTKTEFSDPNYIRGTLYRTFGSYLLPPSGYMDLYFFINLLFFEIRYDYNLFRYTSDPVELFEAGVDPNSGKLWTKYLTYDRK